MKKKILALLIFAVITFSLFLGILFLPSFLYSSPKIHDIILKGYDESANSFEVTVKIENTANIDVFVKEANIEILNDIGKIGTTKISNIKLPKGKIVEIDTLVKPIEGKALEEFLSELLSKGLAKFYYLGKIKATLPILNFLSLDVEIEKELGTFKLFKAESLFKIIKIKATKETKVEVEILNPTNINIQINEIKGSVYYSDKKIGETFSSTKLALIPEEKIVTFLDMNIIEENISKAISDLLTYKNITIKWIGYVNLIFGGYFSKVKIEANKQINFDFNLNANIKNVVFETQNSASVTLDSSIKLFDVFDVLFNVINLKFNAYVGNDLIGTGEISNIEVNKEIIENVILSLNINSKGLASLISVFFTNQTVDITLKNIKGTIEILNKRVQIEVKRSISIPASYKALGIGFEAEIYSIIPTLDNRNLNITLNLITHASNIKGLKLQLINPTFKLHHPEENITLKIEAKNILFTDQSEIKVSVILRLGDPLTDKLFTLFLTKGKIMFVIQEMNGTLKIGQNLIPISLKIDQQIEIIPLSLINVKVEAGLIESPSLGIFEVTINVTIDVKSKIRTQLAIMQIIYDVYSDDESILIAKNVTTQRKELEWKIPLVYITEPGEKTFSAKVRAKVSIEGLKWIAEKALQGDFINFTVKNVIAYVKLYTLNLTLKIPSYKVVAELYPRLLVMVDEFSFYPNKKLISKVSVNSPNLNFTVKLKELKFDLHDGIKLKKIANVKLLEIEKNVFIKKDQLIVGKFELKFITEDPFEPLGPLLKGEDILIYGTDFVAKAEIAGGELTEIAVPKTIFIRVKAEIEIEADVQILSFNIVSGAKGPIVNGEGLLNVTIKKGIDSPLTLQTADFSVIVLTQRGFEIVGNGKILTGGTIFGGKGILRVNASISLTKAGFAFFGENLFSKGKVEITFANVSMKVKIYDIEGTLPFKDITVPFKGPKLTISIIKIYDVKYDINIESLIPLRIKIKDAEAKADIKIRNPFDFPVTISNINFNAYADVGKIGYGRISGTYTIGPKDSIVIKGVLIKITNSNALIKYYNIRTGCISGLYVYAKGILTASVYGTSFPVNFKTEKSPVPSVCGFPRI